MKTSALPHPRATACSWWLRLGAGLVFLSGAPRAGAQNIGSSFDSVSVGPSFSDTDVFDAEAKKARYHLGPLLLYPQLGITGLGYSNGIGITYDSSDGGQQTTSDRKGDFTANLRGGVRVLVPIGTRYRLAGDVAAVYQWYAYAVEQRRLGVDSSVSALAELGRVRIDARMGIYNATIPLSSELPTLTNERGRGILGGVSLPLGSRLFVRARVQFRDLEHQDTGSFGNEVARLDRTEVGYSLGLGYVMSARLKLDASYQLTQGRYTNDPARDTDGTGYMLGVRYYRDRIFANAQISYRSYDERKGRRAGLYGALATGIRLGRSVDVSVIGYRSRTDSLFLDESTFDEQRAGAALGYTFERLLNLRIAAGAALGGNVYGSDVVLDGVVYRRRDDVLTYRLTLGVRLGKLANVGATLNSSRYTSNVPGYSRDVTEILLNLSLLTEGIQIIK